MRSLNWNLPKLNTSFERIEEAITFVFNVDINRVYSKSRERELTEARRVAVMLMRGNYSEYQIAEKINRDVSSVSYHTREHYNLVATNEDYKNKYIRCCDILSSKPIFKKRKFRYVSKNQ